MTIKKVLSALVLGCLSFVVVFAFQNCGTYAPISGSSTISQSLGQKSELEIKSCAADGVCIDGQMVNFRNDAGAAVKTELMSVHADGFVARFTTPKGRTAVFKLVMKSGTLVPQPVSGYRMQFCMNHNTSSDNRCNLVSINNLQEWNCASPVRWSGAYVGDTVQQSFVCTAQNAPAASTTTTPTTVTVNPAVEQQIAYLQQTQSDVSQRLNNSSTNDAEKSVIQSLVLAPTAAPPTTYPSATSRQLTGDDYKINPYACQNMQNASVDRSQMPAKNDSFVPLDSFPVESLNTRLSQYNPDNYCDDNGDGTVDRQVLASTCFVSFRGRAEGSCRVDTTWQPKYSCGKSWVLTCKQFCESIQQHLNLPSGVGWTCDYGGLSYGMTPNHNPFTYKDTDRRFVSWDL